MIYNEEYLNNLIHDRIEENIHLDYKAAGALDKTKPHQTIKDSISKDVAAFANADGGVLIYGLKEDKDNKHLVNEIDPIDRNSISKEWLEQIIQTSIQPRIDGIIIHPIQIAGDIQKVAYLVEVPQSNTAHQSSDQRYYKRHNFNNLPMYDYEIRDVMNRAKHPRIEIEIGLHTLHDDMEDGYHLVIYARNVGTVFANYVNCFVSIPADYLVNDDDPYQSSHFNIKAYNTIRDYLGYSKDNGLEYGPKRYQPVLPQTRVKLAYSGNAVLNSRYKECKLQFTVHADSAPPLIKTCDLKDIEVLHY